MNSLTVRKTNEKALSVEPGNDLPAWVTAELIEATLEVWQPRYSYQLTRDDAIAIIKSVGHLFEVLRQRPIDETVCSDSESEQS